MSKTTIFSEFLRNLNIPHTSCFSDNRFNVSPYADTVQGFRNLLDEYGICSKVLHVDKNDPGSIATPFVVQLRGQLAIVTKVTDRSVNVWANGKTVSIPTDDFARQWSGAAIVVSPCETACEPAYANHRRLKTLALVRRFGITICSIALLAWFFYVNRLWQDAPTALIAILDMIGIYICVMLVGKQLHISNSTADAMCGFLKKGGCDSVLDTSASKIFGIIGWGEVGLAYFSVSLIALVFYPSALPYLALSNACCLPYTIWSITYQKFKAKSWCTLCVIVQTLQWLLFGAYLLARAWKGLLPLRPDVVVLGVGYLLALLLIDRALPVIAAARRQRSTEAMYGNLRLRRNVFDIQQSLQPGTPAADQASAIVFGPADAQDTVIIFNGVTGNQSAQANRHIETLLMKGYRVIYVIAPRPADNATDKSFENDVRRRLIGAYMANGAEKAWPIFAGWYASTHDSLDYFNDIDCASKSADGTDPVGDELARQQSWIKDAYLYSTPTFIFNGRLLSDIYTPTDLLYLY